MFSSMLPSLNVSTPIGNSNNVSGSGSLASGAKHRKPVNIPRVRVKDIHLKDRLNTDSSPANH